MAASIAVVDGNNFYASAEKLFDPALKLCPLVIASNNDGNVVSRSKEAKALKIKMGQPIFEVRNLLKKHKGEIRSSNYELYANMSWRFQTALYDYSPFIEHYSIDEVFMELWPTPTGTLTEIGHQIRGEIEALTGVSVSVGLAETKTLAKIAIELAKNSTKAGGVLDLTGSRFQDLALQRTPIGEVWGIGHRSAEKLLQRGITNALQFRDADASWVRQRFTVTGARTQLELRGVQCLPLQLTAKTKQQLCCSRSFGAATDSLSEIRAAVAHFTTRTAEKLREYGLVAGQLSVFVATDRFKDSPQYSNTATLAVAPKSSSTIELMALAQHGLSVIYRPEFEIRKAGVLLSRLELAENAPRQLWNGSLDEIHQRLMAAIDSVNEKFGKDTLRCGLWPSSGIWQTRAANLSPRHTTRWNEIMTAI